MKRDRLAAAAAAAFIASTVLGAASLAGSAATRRTASWRPQPAGCPRCQRVSVQERIFHVGTSQYGTFVLTPLGKGPVKRDSGIFHYVWESGAGTTRHGRNVAIERGIDILHGRRGMLELGRTLTRVDPGVGVRTTHGTSTWTILAGSGAYAGLRGQGRGVTVISPSETENSVYDGVVRRVLP